MYIKPDGTPGNDLDEHQRQLEIDELNRKYHEFWNEMQQARESSQSKSDIFLQRI